MNDNYLSVKEFAAAAGVTTQYIYNNNKCQNYFYYCL